MIEFLAKFPSTNALVATGCVMAITTMIAVLVGWHPPEGWFLFVDGFAGVGVAQFTSKRVTQHKPT